MRHQLKLNWHHKRVVNRKLTHEQFVHEIAALGVGLLAEEEKAKARASKLTYGAGNAGLRGVTYFNRWLNDKNEQQHFVEICANGEESPVQLAGTTLHELGHVVAGTTAGHKKEWHQACDRLGLRAIKAAGTSYTLAMFSPTIRGQVAALIERLGDGKPNGHGQINVRNPRPCSAGIGTRGGKSRGVGSGSRMLKYQCSCGQIIRAATAELDATHNVCGTLFKLS